MPPCLFVVFPDLSLVALVAVVAVRPVLCQVNQVVAEVVSAAAVVADLHAEKGHLAPCKVKGHAPVHLPVLLVASESPAAVVVAAVVPVFAAAVVV